MLLVLTNGTYDISQEAADEISARLADEAAVVSIELDIFEEGNPSKTMLAMRHVVALIDYRRPDAHLAGMASGKVRSIGA